MSPKGEMPFAPQAKHFLGNSTAPSTRKGFNPMPSPLGEGQADMPIITIIWVRSNRHADQSSDPSPFIIFLLLFDSSVFSKFFRIADCANLMLWHSVRTMIQLVTSHAFMI